MTDASATTTHSSPLDGGADARVQIRNLHKQFRRIGGEIVTAIDDINLDVAPGEFLVLLGPSGCGKTTLLRSIAGLEEPDQGRITVAGKDVFDAERRINRSPDRRPLSMIFQSYALWPHMTVAENIDFPLQSARLPKEERRRRIKDILTRSGIPQLGDQYPGEISGGQQQRVALARAMVSNADTILFDEPLSNVDAKVRDQLRVELLRMQRELGFTAIYVTHDQQEAMSLATRIAVLRDGRVEQLGSPEEIYARPRNLYVARFIGSLNELPATERVEDSDGFWRFTTPVGPVRTTATSPDPGPGALMVVSRPEAWRVTSERPDAANRWRGSVVSSAFFGFYTEYIVQVEDEVLKVWAHGSLQHHDGDDVWVSIVADALRPLPVDEGAT